MSGVGGGGSDRETRGRRIATLLYRGWRAGEAPSALGPVELDGITPALLASGAGGLGWCRVRDSPFADSASAAELRQAHRLYCVTNAVVEAEIGPVFAAFHAAGLTPLLGKGWSVGRLYPEPGMRPYGDIDLYLPAGQHEPARRVLGDLGAPAGRVDLHRGGAELDDRAFGILLDRAEHADCAGFPVRLLGHEDNLRLICLHMLREGAVRPLWLCDVAVALERRPAEFDWDYFASGDRWRADAAACAIGLAHQALGARVDDTPIAARARTLPAWLLPALLTEWSRSRPTRGQRLPISRSWRRPGALLDGLRSRWPNAIEATAGLGAPFAAGPRLPYQLAHSLQRTVRLVATILRSGS